MYVYMQYPFNYSKKGLHCLNTLFILTVLFYLNGNHFGLHFFVVYFIYGFEQLKHKIYIKLLTKFLFHLISIISKFL